jgi:carboxyl-terminal processing protease
MTIGFSGHFLDKPLLLGVMKTRDSELTLTANPRTVNTKGEPVTPLDKPLAILVDAISASTSEMFAGAMQSLGRARIFGAATLGEVLPAVYDKLPNGDLFLHAFGDFRTAKGDRLEGRGVIPDSPVELTREDLLAGRDAVFEAAAEWIARQRKTE